MRRMTTAERRNRDAKLEAMSPCARAWFYDRELAARRDEDAWDRFLKSEFGDK